MVLSNSNNALSTLADTSREEEVSALVAAPSLCTTVSSGVYSIRSFLSWHK